MRKTSSLTARRIRIAGLITAAAAAALSFPAAAPGPGEEYHRIEILPRVLTERPISPLIYGNFIELGFGAQSDRMWAEQLFNRSFENVPPFKRHVQEWLDRTEEDDLSVEPWWHSGYERNPWRLSPDNSDARAAPQSHWGFRHGESALAVRNDSESLPAVVFQDGIYLRKDVAYNWSGWICAGDETGRDVAEHPTRITVGLYPENNPDRPIEAREFPIRSGVFRRFEAEFKTHGFEGRARLAFSVPPGGKIRVDAFSLLPSDNTRGWRKEVIAALRRVNPPVLRFPGGCFASFYNWRDGIGPRIDRRPRESVYWGGLENNDVGTAEFVDLCRMVNAEPFICLNLMTGSASEAAAWAAYCNSGPDHPLGRLRSEHGFQEPFRVKYWELDNETYRRFGSREYARRCVEFSRAVKAEDPSARLVMVGYWRFNDHLNEMLEIAGPDIDGITDRDVSEAGLLRDLAVIREYNRAHGRDIFLCNTEWLPARAIGDILPEAGILTGEDLEGSLQNRQIRWGYAMNAAYHLLGFQRLGGDFLFANFNNLANTWGQNVIECSKEKTWLSASGRVFELMSRSPAAWPLDQRAVMPNPGVVFQPAWDLDKGTLILTWLNFGRDPVQAECDFSRLDFRPSRMEASRLTADSPQAWNTADRQDAVRRDDFQARLEPGPRIRIELPPFSLSQISLRE